jgi:hypothetical protein
MVEEKYEIREIVVEKPELKHLTYLRKDDIEEFMYSGFGERAFP